MPTTLEYMQLAARVYDASDRNKIDLPEHWAQVSWVPDRFLGFSAGVYKNEMTNEYVISYTGTNEAVDTLSWTAGMGIPAPQIFDAMNFYFEFRKAHRDATNISFTGHSLGGGLASLMAVFFDKQAEVFDQAPFKLAAISGAVLSEAADTMNNAEYYDTKLANYLGKPSLDA
jgi:hypothetical protein